MEFNVVKEQLPVIQFNFDELKAALSETMSKYMGAIVTEDNLQGCKATQKELAGIRTKIDRYRIDKKKELSKPIAEFEAQCKELVDLVEKAEEPIKEGIKVFDDKTRENKRMFALGCIERIVVEQQLNEKYARQLTVLDNYTNLTAKERAVDEDIQIRAEVLKQQQITELEMLEIIKDTIENANKNINAKLSLRDFQMLIDNGTSTKIIINEINSRAERINKAEIEAEELRIKNELDKKLAEEERQRIAALPKEQEVVEEEIEPTIEECDQFKTTNDAIINAVKEIIQETKPAVQDLYFVELRVVANKEDIAKLGQYLRDNNFNYTRTNTGKID